MYLLWTLLAILLSIFLCLAWFSARSTGRDALVQECRAQGIPTIAKKSFLRDWSALISLPAKVLFFSVEKNVRIFTTEPLLLKELLVHNAEFYCKPSFVRVLEVLGDGVFSSCGVDWSRQRELLNPHFLNKEIKTKVSPMVFCTISTVQNLRRSFKDNDTIEIDVHKLFLKLTLDILNSTTFEASEIESDSEKILRSLSRYHQYKRKLASTTFPGYWFLQAKLYRDESYLIKLMKKIIAKRRSNKQPTLVVDFLVEACENNIITLKELLDNAMTLLLAGHETTASLLVWTFYLLGLHPAWQEQARSEAFERFKEEADFNLVTLGRCKTLANILMEVLRLYPPQPLIGRACIKEHKLGQYRIPVGLEVVVPVGSLHRDEGLWGKDAAEFRPDRFANGINRACSHPLAFLPFGSGPRTCMGQALALSEAKVVLAVFLKTFRWEVSPSYRHSPDVTHTLQPKFGLPVILKRLERL